MQVLCPGNYCARTKIVVERSTVRNIRSHLCIRGTQPRSCYVVASVKSIPSLQPSILFPFCCSCPSRDSRGRSLLVPSLPPLRSSLCPRKRRDFFLNPALRSKRRNLILASLQYISAVRLSIQSGRGGIRGRRIRSTELSVPIHEPHPSPPPRASIQEHIQRG